MGKGNAYDCTENFDSTSVKQKFVLGVKPNASEIEQIVAEIVLKISRESYMETVLHNAENNVTAKYASENLLRNKRANKLSEKFLAHFKNQSLKIKQNKILEMENLQASAPVEMDETELLDDEAERIMEEILSKTSSYATFFSNAESKIDSKEASHSEDISEFSKQDDSDMLEDRFSNLIIPSKFERKKLLVRYTVHEDFFDHWCNKSKMDEARMNGILSLWENDNWEGLYDPPVWLTTDMFCMALTNETSNKKKAAKLMEATSNLHLARITSSKEMPDTLKKRAIDYIHNLKEMTEVDLSEPFIKDSKNLALTMFRIYQNMQDLSEQQDVENIKLKNEFLLTVNNVVRRWNDKMSNDEKILKTNERIAKFLIQDVQNN